MSLSTTSTATFLLAKYSRAHPTHSTTSETDVTWQHYTNPVIQLVLDIKKSSAGDLESYRVRVVWLLNTSPDAMELDQREVVFEDVDLLAFSAASTLESQRHNFAAHGLPLKAVYRDAVVGIRYMHPRVISKNATPTYRRFQMNFQQASDAIQFTDAIKLVCPCTSAPASAMPARSVTMTPASNSSGSLHMPPPDLPVRNTKTLVRSATTQGQVLPVSRHVHEASSKGLSPGIIEPITASSAEGCNRATLPITAVNAADPVPSASTWPPASLRAPEQKTPSAAHQDQLSSTASSYQLSSSLSVSANLATSSPGVSSNVSSPSVLATGHVQPTLRSSVLHEQIPTCASKDLASIEETSSQHRQSVPLGVSQPSVSAQVSEQDAPPKTTVEMSDFINSLREEPTLYKLPRDELESLVASIVREDGFAQLLESLDSMWRIKAFIGTAS